jgi:hypothetical protein
MSVGFLVLGAESSGTRLVTQLLIDAGCEGGAEHKQPFDDGFPLASGCVVLRRSVPHEWGWPYISRTVEVMRKAGYDVISLVCVRDHRCTVLSQVKAGHVPDLETAEENTQRAYHLIFQGLYEAGVEFILAPYEAIVDRPFSWLCGVCLMTGLPLPDRVSVEVYDGNEKHYA